MKKWLLVLLALFMVFLVSGCGEKREERNVKLDRVITDLVEYNEKKVNRSPNSEEFMPGIYVGKERIDYYSINKLSDMTFNERAGLLDKMDAEPEFTLS